MACFYKHFAPNGAWCIYELGIFPQDSLIGGETELSHILVPRNTIGQSGNMKSIWCDYLNSVRSVMFIDRPRPTK